MLILVRHGRTDANAAGLLQGRRDLPLDALGTQQAQAVAAAIGPVGRVVTSPLLRARQTAAAFGAPVSVDERWIELDYGQWEARPIRDVPGEIWATWRTDVDFAPPDGESLASVGSRVRDACEELREEAESATVLVVSHVSPIKAALCWGLGISDEFTWRLHLATASVSRIAVASDSLVVMSCNENVPLMS